MRHVRPGARIVVSPRRDRRGHAHAGVPALDRVVAAREQRLVGGGGGARPAAVELGLPEAAEVRLVPDVDGGYLGVAVEQGGNEAAVGSAGGYTARRRARGAEAAQHDL